jgi:Fur family transcriptional regulator, ferric uptake regulator
VNAADRSPSPYGSGRVTPQRRLIAETASRMGGAFSIDELAAAVRVDDDATGVATVYRAVSALLASGWLERVGERDGSALLVRCHAGAAHHHHVVCDGCGRVEATPCPVVSEDLAAESSAPSAGGFVITRHEVTLYGLCPACAEKNATPAAAGKPKAG